MCKQEDTLAQVAEIIAKERVHRVFVVDDHRMLMGAVSLEDILDQMATAWLLPHTNTYL